MGVGVVVGGGGGGSAGRRWCGLCRKQCPIKLDDPDRAQGLHCLLYKCPACGTEGKTDSAGDSIWCNECNKKWRQDEYGVLHAESGETEFEGHIPSWSAWERACVREEIRSGTYYFEDEIRLETLPGSLKFYKHGKGKLIQSPEGTRIEAESLYGEPAVIEKKPLALDSLHIEYDYLGRGDCVDISVSDDSYWCYLTKRDAITKLSFATEEIHFFAREKEEERKALAAAKKAQEKKAED